MFKLNRDVEYALIGLLALKQDETVSIRDIATTHNIPFEKLSKIFQQLGKVGIVKAHYGVKGGYQPQMNPEEISIMDVMNALHGKVAITPCSNTSENCGRTETCSIRGGIIKLQMQLEHSLTSLTLKELLP